MQLPFNSADLVVLVILVAVVTAIVRGMLRGTIRTCDSASCSGDCGGCGHQCATPRISLTAEQAAQLDELTRHAKETA